MPLRAGPGNHRGHESWPEGGNLHIEAKAVSGVGELFTVGGHGRAPPSFLLLLVNPIHGPTRLHAKELPDIRPPDSASEQQRRRLQRAAGRDHLRRAHGYLGAPALRVVVGCLHAGCPSLLDKDAVGSAMNDDLRAILVGVEQEGSPRGLLTTCLIAEAGVARHQRLEYLWIPVDESLFTEIAELLAALSHAEVLGVPVCGLLICLKALLHRFYVPVELSGVDPFEAVLPSPILANQRRRDDAVHPIYFCAAAQ